MSTESWSGIFVLAILALLVFVRLSHHLYYRAQSMRLRRQRRKHLAPKLRYWSD